MTHRQSCKFAYPSVSRKIVKKNENFWKISKLKPKIEIYKISWRSQNFDFFENKILIISWKSQIIDILKISKFGIIWLKISKCRLFLENLKIWYNLTENLKFLHNFQHSHFLNILAYPGYATFTTLLTGVGARPSPLAQTCRPNARRHAITVLCTGRAFGHITWWTFTFLFVGKFGNRKDFERYGYSLCNGLTAE